MSEALLQVRNLESFYGPVMAIRGVSLDVPEGKIVAVLGANGAGKTTLLRTVSGIMDPEKGEVLLSGEPIQRERSRSDRSQGDRACARRGGRSFRCSRSRKT